MHGLSAMRVWLIRPNAGTDWNKDSRVSNGVHQGSVRFRRFTLSFLCSWTHPAQQTLLWQEARRIPCMQGQMMKKLFFCQTGQRPLALQVLIWLTRVHARAFWSNKQDAYLVSCCYYFNVLRCLGTNGAAVNTISHLACLNAKAKFHWARTNWCLMLTKQNAGNEYIIVTSVYTCMLII
jgi:hypothetical protein